MEENKKVTQQIKAMPGNFELYGVVEKLDKSKFEDETKTGRKRRSLSIGIRTSKDNLVYLNLNAIAQDIVYFSKRNEDGTNEQKQVPWDDRNKFAIEGFLPMQRIKIGVLQTLSIDGERENETTIKIMYDALQEIFENVEVGDVLSVGGSVEVESYTNQNGEKRSIVKLIPNRMYKSTKVDTIDFDAEGFKEINSLTQKFIPTSVEIDEEAERAILFGLVIGYKKEGTIEIEIVGKENLRFAEVLSERIAEYPFMSIDVVTRIVNEANVGRGQKVHDDFFGVSAMPARRASGTGTKYEYVAPVLGSQDLETYNEENIQEFRNTFCRGKEEFGVKNDSAVGGSENWGKI